MTTITQNRHQKLTSNWFIIGLITLLFNDFYLKYSYQNILTGKLSDFAGLFVFPFFISVVIPRPKAIYLLTALFFTFWKLDFSRTFIEYISKLTDLGFYRTVDPTDLIALTILPISYNYLQTNHTNHSQNRFIYLIFISTISIFSFFATTLPRQTIRADIKVNKIFKLPISKEALFKQLNYAHMFNDTLQKNLTDTLFYLYFQMPDYLAEATTIAKIKSLSKDKTIIQLDSITEYHITGRLFSGIKQSNIDGCKSLKSTDFENIFESEYIDYLLKKKVNGHGLFFDNKELLDKYQGKNNYR